MTALDESDLPDGWREQTSPHARARRRLAARRRDGALLRVPSAIVPEAANYLLNPAHADAARIDASRSRGCARRSIRALMAAFLEVLRQTARRCRPARRGRPRPRSSGR